MKIAAAYETNITMPQTIAGVYRGPDFYNKNPLSDLKRFGCRRAHKTQRDTTHRMCGAYGNGRPSAPKTPYVRASMLSQIFPFRFAGPGNNHYTPINVGNVARSISNRPWPINFFRQRNSFAGDLGPSKICSFFFFYCI